MGNAIATELLDRPISSLVPKDQKLIWIEENATVATALGQLKESGVSHLPIRGTNGTVSFSDLMYYLADLDFDKAQFLNSPATRAMRKHHSLLVQPSSTISSVLLRMCRYRPYRVCVTGEDPNDLEIKGIVSQSDIVRYIYEHRKDLLPDADQKLMQVNVGTKGKIVSVNESDTVKQVVNTLNTRRVHAVAVVDDKGLMKASVVPASFRQLSPDHWVNFDAPIGSFEVAGRDQGWVTDNETFGDIVGKLVDHHLHRIFVLTDAGHPGRVITLSDIMRHILVSTEAGREAREKHKEERRQKKAARKDRKKDKRRRKKD